MGAQSSDRPPRASLGSRIIASARAHPNLSLALIVLAAGAAYVAATVVWPGRRAKAAAVVEAVGAALQRGDAAAVMEHVSSGFSAEGLSRGALEEGLADVLRAHPLGRVKVAVREVLIDQDSATVKVHVTSGSQAGSWQNRSEWLVVLEKVDDRWLIVDVQAVHISNRGVWGVGDILRTNRRVPAQAAPPSPAGDSE